MTSLLLSGLLFISASLAQAATPFHPDDFVSIPELEIEVQRHEITYTQWNALNAWLPAGNQSPWQAQDCDIKEHISKGFGPTFAAACISHNDAEAYIKVLNSQDKKYRYRMPTDNELKTLIAMTLGALKFQDGDISDSLLAKHAWYYQAGGAHPHEVCTKDAVLSLCDLLGNLWELTSTPVDSEISVRGGSYMDDVKVLRDARRTDSNYPNDRKSYLGLRLVRELK